MTLAKSEYFKTKKAQRIVFCVLLVIYCVWFLLFINKGLDITDAGYVLAQYKYAFTPGMSISSGTAMTVILGGTLWNLIPTAQVLVLSIISAVLYTIDGLLIYLMLRKYANPFLLLGVLFGGAFYAITWVHVLSYNAWSMFFLTVEIFFLYKWFDTQKMPYIMCCGLLYGFSIWVRLPNAVHGICLLAVIWYILHREKKAGLWKHLIFMLVAAVVGLMAGGLIVLHFTGMDAIQSGLQNTMNIATDTSSTDGHTFLSMFQVIKDYLWDGIKHLWKYVALFAALFACEAGIAVLAKRKFQKSITGKGLLIVNTVIGLAAAFVVFRYRYQESTWLSMYIVLAIALSAVGMIYFRKKDPTLSSLCFLTCLLELTIKFGTDVSVLWNRVFLFLPLAMIVCMFSTLLRTRFRAAAFTCLAFVEAMVLLGGFQLATTYVYRDDSLDQLQYAVQADAYKGIRTSQERASFIDTLEEQLSALPEGELLAMGDCTVGSVISDHMPALGSAWPDLRSYSYERLCADLDAKIEQGTFPYILMTNFETGYREGREEKYEKVYEVVEEYAYEIVYEDENMTLYVPQTE